MRQIPVSKNAWMVKDAEESAETLVIDVKQQKLVRTVRLGNQSAHVLWPTHDGNLVVRVGNELWLYDERLEKTTRFPLSTEYAPFEIQVSPDGRMIMAQRMLYQGKREDHLVTDLLQTDTLAPVVLRNAPRVLHLVSTGFIEVDEKANGDIYFRPFSNSTGKLLVKGKGRCSPHAQAVASDRVLVASCSAKKGQVVNLAGAPIHQIGDPSWDFAQTSVSGRAFVLGFQQYSKAHFLKDLNLLAVLAGVDDPADVVVLKAYERDSEKPILELGWKPAKSEPLYNSYDNFSVGLSPDGQLMAIVRGSWLEVYQLPISQ